MVTGNCIRGARALLGWSASMLARKAKIGTATVLRIERQKESVSGQNRTIGQIEQALRGAGVRISEDGEGVFDIHFDSHRASDDAEDCAGSPRSKLS